MSPALILAAIGAAEELVKFIKGVIKTNKQSAAWTDADRAAVDARWASLKVSAAWQTDADKGL